MTTPSIAELKDTWTRRSVVTNDLSRTGIKLLADGQPVTAAAWLRPRASASTKPSPTSR